MEFTASRLSEGNKLFPARITITPQGVTLKVPSFLGGKEQSIPFHLISSVDLETPFVGYSTIKIYSVGWDVIIASGFSKADVKQIKEQIMNGQHNLNNPAPKLTTNHSSETIKPQAQANQSSETKINIKWSEELREMKELLDDEVISANDFEEQKLKVMGSISLDGNFKLSDALRELKNLQEDEIITEGEFNILKKNLMNK